METKKGILALILAAVLVVLFLSYLLPELSERKVLEAGQNAGLANTDRLIEELEAEVALQNERRDTEALIAANALDARLKAGGDATAIRLEAEMLLATGMGALSPGTRQTLQDVITAAGR